MQVSQNLTDRLLRWVHAAEYRPSKPKHIATHLKLDLDEYRELRRVIKQLVLEGRLVYGGNHLVMAAAAVGGASDSIRGKFRRAMGGGFGFVRPSSGGTGVNDDVPEDIFIPPGSTGGAMEGDLVEVQISPGRRGGVEGVVTAVVQRERRQFTGTFRTTAMPSEDGSVWASTVEGPVVYLDGVHFDTPVSVGDVRGLPLVDDDKVFVEIVDFPDDRGHGGEAVILERLGSSKNPSIDTLTIMRQYGLPDEFPAAVLDEARVRADEFDEENPPVDRKDLTELLTITIDPFDARDFDDAISLQREETDDGGVRWRLWVHIADVSHFVHPGGAIDVEARQRGTSVYLPDRVIPMIPEIISNHLASLQPERHRLVKTVEIEMLDDLTVTHTEVHNAVIRSDKRFNYEQIDQYLAARESFVEDWGVEICTLLDHMHDLAMRIRKRRFKSGSLSMDMPDIKLELDRNGKVKGAHLVEHTESHQIIEEFMLAGNQAVAYWLDTLELNFLHRIHAPPERRKLRMLSAFVKDLGIGIENIESRFEIQAVLDKVAGTPLENAVNFSVLKSMNKAVYGPHREGHYALDMEHYCHFTSPIRRYPDLSVHRLVQKLIDKKSTPDDSFAELVKLGHECSDAERNAAQAERELIELKLLHFLKKKVGETLEAVISRVFSDGIHARCIKLPVDGFVPVTTLPKDQYRFERNGQMLIGFKEGNRYRLGDQVTVKIDKVDLQDRQLYLSIIKNHSAGRPLGLAARPPKKTGVNYKAKRKHERRAKKKKRRR
ncbi:ribonuclease R family protein [Neorhodopirellula pilleata]|uniref:Ribonuclease R n=1 Tax=Neorhodopirellula pilleata TaxID=2714738 RepID=A0A5C6AHK7_9BACT|nr:VacB/RNase II family 3'-5' exoribonuclease [Neorhodopirellula pilleata]TWT98738.1 Ribonuclease R [Neorhodopirellula pilleata]